MKTVLSISGLDPTGGAGLLADAEAIRAAGCHPLMLMTANTIQDSHNISSIDSVSVELLQQGLSCLTGDFKIDAIKIGMLADHQQINWLIETLPDMKIPIVLDPLLAAGGGYKWHASESRARFRDLAGIVTVSTPNASEQAELNLPGNILLTDNNSSKQDVICELVLKEKRTTWQHPRLPHTYHGTGCTMASFLAAQLALGLSLEQSAYKAFEFMNASLKNDYQLGSGQRFFNRSQAR